MVSSSFLSKMIESMDGLFERILATVRFPEETVLARLVVEKGFAREEQLHGILRECGESPVLGAMLLRNKVVTIPQLCELLAEREQRLNEQIDTSQGEMLPRRKGTHLGLILVSGGLLSPRQFLESLRDGENPEESFPSVIARKGLLPVDKMRPYLYCGLCGAKISDPAWQPFQELLCSTCTPLPAALPSVTGTAEALRPGLQFGRYRLEEEVAHGDISSIWKATDPQSRRSVALKIFSVPPSSGWLRGAAALTRLQHPNILPVHEAGIFQGNAFLACELLDGKPINPREGALPWRTVLEIGRTIGEALAYAHERQIVHRNIKPSNILLDNQGKPFLADFGAAPGNSHYMSPELITGKIVGPASDQFSLGIVLYEYMTSRRPFEGDSEEKIFESIVAATPAAPSSVVPGLPRAVDEVILRMLEKEPKDRFPDLKAFGAAVDLVLRGKPVRRRPWLSALIGVGIVVSAVAVFLLGNSHEPVDPILEAAFRHEKDAQFEAARDAFQEALAKDPENVFARAGLQRIQSELNRIAAERAILAEAVQTLEGVRKELDSVVRYLRGRDVKYEQVSRLVDEAQKKVESALQHAPRLALGHALLGWCHELKGVDDQAEEAFRRAVGADPAQPLARYRLGWLLLQRLETAEVSHPLTAPMETRSGNQDLAREAVEHFDAASKSEPSLHREIARLLAAMLRNESGLGSLLQEAVSRYAESEGVEELYLAAHLLDRKPRWIDEALKARPHFPLALCLRAGFRLRQGDVPGALRDLDMLLEVAPRAVWPRLHRANARALAENREGAIDDLTRVLAVQRDHLTARMLRAEILMDSRRKEEARRDYEACLPRIPEPWKPFVQGLVLYAAEDLVGAIGFLGDAAETHPDYFFCRRRLALAYADAGEIASAIREAEAALRLAADTWLQKQDLERELGKLKRLQARLPPWLAKSERGKELLRENQWEEARKVLEEALLECPAKEDPLAARVRGTLLRHLARAYVHLAAEDKDKFDLYREAALDRLTRWVEEGGEPPFLLLDIQLAPLQSEARWKKLLNEKP